MPRAISHPIQLGTDYRNLRDADIITIVRDEAIERSHHDHGSVECVARHQMVVGIDCCVDLS